MNRRDFELIARIVQRAEERLPLSQTLKRLCDTYGVGRMEGRTVFLTLKERETLREVAKTSAGADPMIPIRPGDRTALSSVFRKEKWAGAKHRPALLWCTAKGRRLVLGDESFPVPAGGFVAIKVEQLSAVTDPVVVVENFETFLRFDELTLPVQFDRAIGLYRGHDEVARSVKMFLEGTSGSRHVAVFADYDPAGMVVGLTMPGATHLIVPRSSGLAKASNREAFDRQGEQLVAVKGLATGETLAEVDQISRLGLSVSQEAMLSRAIPLSVIQISRAE